MEFKVGKFVEVKTKDQKEYEGTLIDVNSSRIVIKLSNGYNVGILKSNIGSLNYLRKKGEKSKGSKSTSLSKEFEENEEGQKKAEELPLVYMIHTGGTIASKVNYDTGGVSPLFKPKDILSLFPEIRKAARLRTKELFNLFSENIRFEDINSIVDGIKEAIEEEAKGIIITVGTDMLHYVGAALSFLVENPPIPIMLVGAQRSSDRPSSDAKFNLLSAFHFALKSHVPGVFISFHKSSSDDFCVILNGVNARKMHTSRRDAFKPINRRAVALVSLSDFSIKWIANKENFHLSKKPRFYYLNSKLKIGMIYVHPAMSREEISVLSKLDGAIIVGTGLGHIGIDGKNQFIREEIQRAIKKGSIVAIAPQTLFGRINLNVYSTGRRLKELGVLGHECDMTPETAFMKLAFLLSNFSKEEVKKLYGQNLRGEISSRTIYEEGDL